MVERLKGFSLWAVSCLLVLSFALSACSEYIGTAPAQPTLQPAATATVETTPLPVNLVKTNPVILANKPSQPGPTPAQTTANIPAPAGAKPAQNSPAAVISKDQVFQGLGTNPGFYEFPYADSEFYIHMPPAPPPGKTLQIILAIHGMGNNGVNFGKPLISYADQYGFALVAPTMLYDPDYTNPAKVAANDLTLLPELHSLVQALPGIIGYPVNQQVMLFGFSRGAQIVHRFALFYPEQVRGVALMSAGSYTLPYQDYKTSDSTATTTLRFPFGVSDLAKFTGHNFDIEALRKVPFWIGVGGADNATKDVPAAWSPYLGQTRVERATRFYQALQKSGINATFNIFPGVGHTVCTDMKQDGFAFFNKLLG
jgi:predicted esterase